MFGAIKKLIHNTINTDEEETKERLELGITPELLQLVDNISKYPESFKDFPFHTLKNSSLKMTKLQKRHVEKILEIVKPLNDLRYSICPSFMDDEKFWRIYFTHIKSVTNGIFEPTPSTPSTKSNDFLDELDSKFDQLSATQKKMILDEGISEEEDSYFSENKYKLQFINKESVSNLNNKINNTPTITSPTTTTTTSVLSPTSTSTSTSIVSGQTSPASPSTQINSNKNINNDNILIDTSFDNIDKNYNNNNSNNNNNNNNNNILNNNNNNSNNNNNIDNIFNTLNPS